MVEEVLIYATGGDMQMRQVCWLLLSMGIVRQADALEHTSRFFVDDGKQKLRPVGGSVLLLANRSDLERVMQVIRAEYTDSDLRVIAVPVLASVP